MESIHGNGSSNDLRTDHFQHGFYHNELWTTRSANSLGEIHGSTSSKMLSRSSSSSSESDTSDEDRDPFQLLADTTSKTHVDAAVPQKVDKDHHRGILEPELNHTVSVMEPGHQRIPTNDSRKYPANGLGETHVSTSGKKLGHSSSSSSSTSDSSSDDPFQLLTSTPSKTTGGAVVPQKVNEDHHRGPLEPESHHTFSVKEDGQKTMTNNELGTHHANILWAAHSSSTGKKLGPSSSLSSCEDQSKFSKKPEEISQVKPDKDHDRGLVELESHQMFPEREEGNKSANNNDLRTHPVEVLGNSIPVEKLGSSLSSSSSDTKSSSRDSSQLSVKPTSNSPTSTTFQLKKEEDSRLSSDSSDDDIPVSSKAKHEQSSGWVGQPSPPESPGQNGELGSSNGSATQHPPVQVMERPEDLASSSSYRIPSHVFARTKSTTPMEWSVTSNESLFSIHVGNMSFSRDQQYLLGRSGELYKPGDTTMSDQLSDFSSTAPPLSRSSDISQGTANLNETSRVTEAKAAEAKAAKAREAEAKAAETMREVIRENIENRMKENVEQMEKSPIHSARISQNSDGSTKSFAFSALTGDAEKAFSPKVGEEKPKQPVQSQPRTPKETPVENEAQTPKSTSNATQTQNKSWFSCFSCPFCC
ncbi:Homeobox-like protein [Quillaja saponaria]|uniref:Homeobox-like protein n=1 Tax=Quillaja saponaria TaxID=32244 RepID=A0AAD7QBZ5_QUISA|nr:Homeobox-like protein [Quillaja saponaria]